MRDGVGDGDWQRFYSLYEKPILAFAAARSLNEADCQDVLQETMVRMLRVGFERFDPEKGKFTGFLFNVARGCAVDAIRRRTRTQSRHIAIDASSADETSQPHRQLPDKTETPAEAAERQGQMALALTVLDYLIEQRCFQPKTIGLFKAATIQQRTPDEIATAFQTSTGNVYQAKHAVLIKLRSTLDALDRGLDLEQALVS